MKLLSVKLARTIWLGNVSDFNPKGASMYATLFPFLIATYKFKKFPPYTEIADLSKGVVFESGEFKIDENVPIGVNLTFYNDGIVADCGSSTSDSDTFLKDIFHRFLEIYKIPHYDSVIKKVVYVSEVFVSTEKSLDIINPKLNKISEFLSGTVEQGTTSFQLGGVLFFPDQTYKIPPGPFRFERAIGFPFSENRYYSAAPLTTDKHLELLNELESILSE
jgi:hypothetical protein